MDNHSKKTDQSTAAAFQSSNETSVRSINAEELREKTASDIRKAYNTHLKQTEK